MRRDKNLKSLEIFKKGFRKNEVVIYAIALMLVTAGYFNYTANVENGAMETYSEEVTNNENSNSKENANTENNETEEINAKSASSNEDKNNNSDIAVTLAKNADSSDDKSNNEQENKSDNKQEENKKDDEEIGDAKLVDSTSVVDSKSIEDSKSATDSKDAVNSDKVENSKDVVNEASDYFVSTKLQRDTNYADTLSTYTKILEDGSVSETQKSIAMKEITKINDTKNAISICENLLSTKGFEHYVVLVNNESINVVVKTEGGLTKQKVAQIQNIISREFKCEIVNIHISEK